VSFDLVVAGAPSLDLRFTGVSRLPRPGEEVYASGLRTRPGGAAITALAAARLGLRTAIIWPVGTDAPGIWLAEMLQAERVVWLGPPCAQTPITAIASIDGDRAMLTHSPRPPERAPLPPTRSAVIGLGEPTPSGPRVYVVCDDARSRRSGGGALPDLSRCRAVLVNHAEVQRLTCCSDPERAALRLAAESRARTVVVTLGPDGALAFERSAGKTTRVRAFPAQASDTTGAGDVFAAAYIWADLGGCGLTARLKLACLSAALWLTSAAQAPDRSALHQAARRYGLAMPDGV
jgi:sugar/nucleoside kinase (ribokinase family)